MKRYLMFCGQLHDAEGGAKDLEAQFNTLEESKGCFIELNKKDSIRYYWCNIFDTKKNKIVSEYGYSSPLKWIDK